MNLSLPPFFVNERVSLNLEMEAYEKKTLAAAWREADVLRIYGFARAANE